MIDNPRLTPERMVELEERCEELKETLMYYANTAVYLHSRLPPYIPHILTDNGALARQVLRSDP